jgi:hypothetical protein
MTVPTPLNTSQIVQSPIAHGKNSPSPVCVPVNLDYTAGGDINYSLDIGQLINSQKIDQVTSLYIDNRNNNAQLSVTVSTSGQNITAPPNSQGFYPILAGNSGQFTFEMIGGTAVARAALINVETPYLVWGSEGVAGFIFNGSGYALVSDPVLDATVVGGKVSVSDAALLALLNTVIAGGEVKTTDLTLSTIVTGGKLPVTDATLESIVSGTAANVQQIGESYAHVTGSGATVVKAAAGVLKSIVVGTPAAGTITVNNGAGVVSVITVVAGQAFTLDFNASLNTNISVNPSVAMDLTVIYN